MAAGLKNLELVRVQESLLGTHYYFQQLLHGIEVEGAEIIVSIAKKDGRVYQVYNNTYPVERAPQRVAAALDTEAAFDVAWRRLRVSGELLAQPGARLVYTPEGKGFRLNYLVQLDVAKPLGSWMQRVDAVSGEIHSIEDTRIPRQKTGEVALPVEQRIAAVEGPFWDRDQTFASFEQKQVILEQKLSDIPKANGTAQVFDPDPQTTLNTESLTDTSPASAFTAAYQTRSLLDIQFDGSVYRLNGPYVEIINWDPPATQPSTSASGNWTAVRGVNAFNDAMTYFHLDQNQRYIQSLGYTGATGIQEGPIEADADGWNGGDNSSYTPSSNRLSFGHGCVDDNEDADVILHEYGHAITYSINPSWGGGDMGAIGEGFGDYWAGSYSYSTPNGPVFHPEWMFSWDGHNECWGGRVMDAFGAQYVDTIFYGAHQFITGGYQSDELWSTPCFQSLVTLVGMGETRESVDQIMLEGQFGLGSNVKMREMATSIVAAASALQPAGPHAGVIAQKFQVHNILELIAADLKMQSMVVSDPGVNGVADPGETIGLTVNLSNAGSLGATEISGVLSSSLGEIQMLDDSSSYPDLSIGASGSNSTEFLLAISSNLSCGDPIPLQLTLSYKDGGTPAQSVVDLVLTTGVPTTVSESVSPGLAIPDNNAGGIWSSLVISGTGASVSAGFNVDVNISHSWSGDLLVGLQSPSGTLVTLRQYEGGSLDDVVGNYPGTMTPYQSLSAFYGEPLDGTWQLHVSDGAAQDLGTLNSWGIEDVGAWTCELVSTAVGDPVATRRFALAQNHPNPFNPATVIEFTVPEGGGEVFLEIFDVSGRLVRRLASGPRDAGTQSVIWQGRDESGRAVSSGVYYYRLRARDFEETRRMVLVR